MPLTAPVSGDEARLLAGIRSRSATLEDGRRIVRETTEFIRWAEDMLASAVRQAA